ncbi:hypothetical protein GCG54_00007942 [Colletotrichum gloeosporioides]|uniref:Uncharacterized protein n=1 Tax=Colletotrichum gloeosporioides TaxID=474922 RepID=A0A8H4C5Q3_COLGL|nr:uncharacterized protein GCG54_00007942 [Colletotrichum gloeosporioides]KAF3797889.1 hypothetical protein GCG54_00007942 [Colletotrichum gloeosporioides]
MGSDPHADSGESSSEEEILPNDAKGDHSSCNLSSYKKRGNHEMKDLARPCLHNPKEQCFCSSHRGCMPKTQFTDTEGAISRKTCIKCRFRSANRAKKTPEERAKAKALANIRKAPGISNKKSTKGTITGRVMKTPTKKNRSGQKSIEKSELFVSSESESESEEEDMADDHPKSPGYRQTPDDEDDAPGEDGSMGGGIPGTIIVA